MFRTFGRASREFHELRSEIPPDPVPLKHNDARVSTLPAASVVSRVSGRSPRINALRILPITYRVEQNLVLGA